MYFEVFISFASLVDIPCKSMLDYAGRFSKSMAKPAPLSPFDLTVKRVLSCSIPFFIVSDPVLQPNVEYVF